MVVKNLPFQTFSVFFPPNGHVKQIQQIWKGFHLARRGSCHIWVTPIVNKWWQADRHGSDFDSFIANSCSITATVKSSSLGCVSSVQKVLSPCLHHAGVYLERCDTGAVSASPRFRLPRRPTSSPRWKFRGRDLIFRQAERRDNSLKETRWGEQTAVKTISEGRIRPSGFLCFEQLIDELFLTPADGREFDGCGSHQYKCFYFFSLLDSGTK